MEDDRLRKLETKVEIMTHTQKTMGETLERIAKSFERMNAFYTEAKLLEEKYNSMDRELRESFKRVHTRQDKFDAIISRIVWMAITPIILAVIGTYVKGAV